MLQIIFLLITLAALIVFYYGTGRDKRILWVSLLWIIICGAIAYSGFYADTTIRPPGFLMVPVIAIGLSIFFYKITRDKKISIPLLIAVHILRIPVELILYRLFLQKQVPVLMTFKGWNFDILMGISGVFLLCYILLSKRQVNAKFLIGWNIAGIIFLTIIVTIAVLSSPLPIQQLAFDQPNVALAKFPFVYLPAYVVPMVYLSHILTLRAVKRNSRK